MRVFELNPANPETELICEIASILKEGGTIAYPTDTLYGLGGDGFNPATHDRIMILKGRDGTKPFPYVIDTVERLEQWRMSVGVVGRAIIENFWPGPVSVVMEASSEMPAHIFDRGKTICLRLPQNNIARAIAGALEGLLISTSANLAGLPPACCAREAMSYFRGEIDAVVDGGPSPSAAPSTIVDVTGDEAVIIREGAVSAAKINAVASNAIKRRNI